MNMARKFIFVIMLAVVSRQVYSCESARIKSISPQPACVGTTITFKADPEHTYPEPAKWSWDCVLPPVTYDATGMTQTHTYDYINSYLVALWTVDTEDCGEMAIAASWVNVSGVYKVEAGGVTSYTDSPGEAETLYVAKGPGTVEITATSYAGWPSGKPTWQSNSTLTDVQGHPEQKLLSAATEGKYTVTVTCGDSSKSISIWVIDVNITSPKGSNNYAQCPADSFLKTGPYRFDFQWVVEGTPGPYANTISGIVTPTGGTGENRIDYCWRVSAGRFKDHDADDLRIKSGTDSPVYEPNATGQATLYLSARKSDRLFEKSKVMEVYEDHLARDQANFGTGISCWGQWKFTSHGVEITMDDTWNCHGSVLHAYNGSTNVNSSATVNWPATAYTNFPGDWTAIEASLSRGDVVSFWSYDGQLQHSHTCTGNASSMYGANNEPSANFSNNPVATWKWYVCSSRGYFEAINNAYYQFGGQWPFLTKVKVHHKP